MSKIKLNNKINKKTEKNDPFHGFPLAIIIKWIKLPVTGFF